MEEKFEREIREAFTNYFPGEVSIERNGDRLEISRKGEEIPLAIVGQEDFSMRLSNAIEFNVMFTIFRGFELDQIQWQDGTIDTYTTGKHQKSSPSMYLSHFMELAIDIAKKGVGSIEFKTLAGFPGTNDLSTFYLYQYGDRAMTFHRDRTFRILKGVELKEISVVLDILAKYGFEHC